MMNFSNTASRQTTQSYATQHAKKKKCWQVFYSPLGDSFLNTKRNNVSQLHKQVGCVIAQIKH